MGEHKHGRPHRAFDATRVLRDITVGVCAGAALGILMLGVGALRMGAYLLSRKSLALPNASDIRPLALYVLSFSAGGGVIGLLRQLPVPGSRYVAYSLGGMVAMYGIMFATDTESSHSPVELAVLGCAGMVVGLALAAQSRT